MVNENIIPKTETVYELKDKYEVPSFEEFMKTYERGGLNYSDLSSSDISIGKGYGPCSPSSCSGCSCSRSDCNCQYGERWCNLRLSCPVCPSDKSIKSWGHGSHPWYGVRISNQARIRCNMSYCRTAEIKGWKFKCSNHDGETIESKSSFTLAVLTAINAQRAAENNVDEKLMNELLIYLEEHSW